MLIELIRYFEGNYLSAYGNNCTVHARCFLKNLICHVNERRARVSVFRVIMKNENVDKSFPVPVHVKRLRENYLQKGKGEKGLIAFPSPPRF